MRSAKPSPDRSTTRTSPGMEFVILASDSCAPVSDVGPARQIRLPVTASTMKMRLPTLSAT